MKHSSEVCQSLNVSRLLGIFIAGPLGEMSYSKKFQIVFKKLMQGESYKCWEKVGAWGGMPEI